MRAWAIVMVCLMATGAAAQDVRIFDNDTTRSVIEARKGKRVTLRLASGHELTGVVRETNERLAVIATLAGREYFDAVVPLGSVEAVIIRSKP